MNLKISSYYHKHLLQRLTVANKKRVKATANLSSIASIMGLTVNLADFNQIAKSCCEVEKDPLFVIRTAAKTLPPGHGILGLLVQSCNTLGEACAYGYKFQHLSRSGLHSELQYQRGIVASKIELEGFDPQEAALLVEYCQASLFAIANFLVEWSKPIEIQEVHFMHKALGPISEYKKILNTDVVLFSQAENKIVFSREVMDYPIERADPGSKEVLLLEAKTQLQSISAAEPFVAKVRRLLMDQEVFKSLTLADCAMGLNVSDSTLKRRLLEEGTTYQSITDSVREDQARQLLQHTSSSVQHISEALGFSNRSAFARSFRNWTGLSPLQYRQSIE
jgi:AraC-like DNA-binding protein